MHIERHESKLKTGVVGLDEVLAGGLPAPGLILIQGDPGVGKTTLALQFLRAGAQRGERCLYVALTELAGEVEAVARSHGWSLDGISVLAVDPNKRGKREEEQTFFHPAEVELDETLQPILEEAERVRARRVVIDSISEIRLLAREALRFRRQLLMLKSFFHAQGAAVLLIDTHSLGDGGSVLETMVAGVIVMEKQRPNYGPTRRRLIVDKLRGVGFREGYHDFEIQTGGITIYPRLSPAMGFKNGPREPLPSGVPELDDLLGGGLERGTSTLIVGAAGTGKSSTATQYAIAMAERGERSLLYTFEESVATWLARSRALGFDVEKHVQSGMIEVAQVDPAELTPGQLSSRIRARVEQNTARLVVIDSLNGYLRSVPEEGFLLLHLHDLLAYLSGHGVSTIMIMAQNGLLGPAMSGPIDVSYLADNVLLLRYFEVHGEVRQAISVVKKRSGPHERTIREFMLGTGGVRVGKPLSDFHGVLTGVPTYVGLDDSLMRGAHESNPT